MKIDPTAHVDASARLHPGVVVGAGVHIDAGTIFAAMGDQVTRVGAMAMIGAGAVIGAGVEIGTGAVLEPGTVVLSHVPPNAVVRGNPARIIGYAHGTGTRVAPTSRRFPAVGTRRHIEIEPLGVSDCTVYLMPKIVDMRGALSVGEFTRDLPFLPQRYFMVFDVPSEELRGEHAHHSCQQFLICVRGSCQALVDDGTRRAEITLDDPTVGLYMPPMIWGTQYRYSRDALLLVYASQAYDPADYIRDYSKFLLLAGQIPENIPTG
jgi:UDP-2-acetamido-3-amino-2,3-dideoxy-glucuronate N-acetyltransferase